MDEDYAYEAWKDSILDEADATVSRLHSEDKAKFGHINGQHGYDFFRLNIWNKPKYKHLENDDEKLSAYAADCNAAVDTASYYKARYANE